MNCCAESAQTANGPLECITEGPEVDRVVIPWVHSRNPTETRSATALEQYRIRFYSYNMGNSSEFGSVDELQGPGGRGVSFGTSFTDRFADGENCDVSFATFVETRLNFSDWVAKYLSRSSKQLDSLLMQNARREGVKSNYTRMRSFVEGLAATYNGNLKSMLAFQSSDFEEDINASLFGRLTERKLGGVPVPNPKKSFIGQSLVAKKERIKSQRGARLCLVGAHFPISQVASALEDPEKDPLEGAKIALAKTLRTVLRKASQRNLTDDQTIIFVQGDINSRTVLRGAEVKDALLELLDDDSLQSAIQQELDLPSGRWREVVPHESAHDLPVTYKIRDKMQCQTGNSPTPGSGSKDVQAGDQYLTVGDVISKARLRSASAPEIQKTPTSSSRSRARDAESYYKRTLTDLGQEWLDRWGVAFKKHDFRPFRFPAAADRVICWCSDELYDHLSLDLPRGGYEVTHSQLGSDHRPVTLEVVMRVWSERIRSSIPLKPVRSYTEGALSEPEEPMSEVEDEDLLDSLEASPRTVASSPPAFGEIHSLSRRQLSDPCIANS